MAWPESLTATQQTSVENFATDLRSFAAALFKLNTQAQAITGAWQGGISTLVGSLQAGDVVPNISGLADSLDLTQADITNLANWAGALCNTTNSVQGTGSFNSQTIQNTLIKAAGVNASIA